MIKNQGFVNHSCTTDAQSSGPLGNPMGSRAVQMKDLSVSVVIPSLAEASRADLIHRAIDSVLAQDDVCAVPIVVVNGGRDDSAVLDSIKRGRDVRCIHFSYGGLPEARLK